MLFYKKKLFIDPFKIIVVMQTMYENKPAIENIASLDSSASSLASCVFSNLCKL